MKRGTSASERFLEEMKTHEGRGAIASYTMKRQARTLCSWERDEKTGPHARTIDSTKGGGGVEEKA